MKVAHLRKRVFRFISRSSSLITCVFAILGCLFYVGLPLFAVRGTYFSEHALQPQAGVSGVSESDAIGVSCHNASSIVIESPHATAVHGVIVAVVKEAALSVEVACMLEAAWRRARYRAVDIFLAYVSSANITDELSAIFNEFGDAHLVLGAVVLNVTDRERNCVAVETYGWNGLQTNLDLVNVATHYAVENGLEPSFWLVPPASKLLAHLPSNEPSWFHLFREAAALYNPKHARRVSWNSYVRYFAYQAQLASSCVRAGLHAPLRNMGVHGITLSSSCDGSSRGVVDVPLSVARMVELTVRTGINNLHERLHHSYFVWFPLSTSQFVDNEIAQFQSIAFISTMIASGLVVIQWLQRESLIPHTCTSWVKLCTVFLLLHASAMVECTTLQTCVAKTLFCSVALWCSLSRGEGYCAVVGLCFRNATLLCLSISLHPTLCAISGLVCALQLVPLAMGTRSPSWWCAVVVSACSAFGTAFYLWVHFIDTAMHECTVPHDLTLLVLNGLILTNAPFMVLPLWRN